MGLFTKLNLGPHRVLHVWHAPASFEPELAALAAALPDAVVQRTLAKPCHFAIAFVITQAELDAASRAIAVAAEGDAVIWLAYPKGSSKNYRCEFNRDSGWALLGGAGFEPVRMVAIDADWSALRFRRVEHIGAMARDPARAISKAGAAKAAGKTAASKQPAARKRPT